MQANVPALTAIITSRPMRKLEQIRRFPLGTATSAASFATAADWFATSAESFAINKGSFAVAEFLYMAIQRTVAVSVGRFVTNEQSVVATLWSFRANPRSVVVNP